MATYLLLPIHIHATSASELEKEELCKQIKELKRKTMIGTGIVTGVTTLYVIYHHNSLQQHKRSLMVAASTGANLLWSLTQSTAGCFALGIGYYKVRSYLYDGYAKEKQVQRLDGRLTTCEETINRLIARSTDQENSIAAEEEVLRRHANYLDAGRDMAKEAIERVNHLSELWNEKYGQSSAPLDPISLPNGINNPAAQPQDISRHNFPVTPIPKVKTKKWGCCH